MELIVFVITVLGFLIAYVTYQNTYVKEPNEDVDFLIHKYDNANVATEKLIIELRRYSTINDCSTEQFKEGLSFKESIAFLENACSILFTEENRQSLKLVSMGKRQLDELIKRIDIHRENIEAIQTHLNFYFKKDFTLGKNS